MNPLLSPATTMATFEERLHQMEEIRRQRLSYLPAEKQLQAQKSQILHEKIATARFLEQRCLLLEKRNADLGFQILAKKSEIDALDVKYQASAQELRVLKIYLNELEARQKEKDRFYEVKTSEMEEFKERVRRRALDARREVEGMSSSVFELRSILKDLQDNDGYRNNTEIAAAQERNAELLSIKEDLDKSLHSDYQLRLLLQKQLQKILVSQDTELNVNLISKR